MPFLNDRSRNRLMMAILLAVLPLFMASCERSDGVVSERTPAFNENILRYDVNAPFNSLNPTKVNCSGSTHIFPLLYSFLFVPNDKGELEPDLAIRWSYDSEKMQWIIHLRDDVIFHNRMHLTTKDVKYSFETLLKDRYSEFGSVIDRISLISDTSFCIHLKKEDPLILQKIWELQIIPYPENQEIDFNRLPIGSGPFRFKSRKEDQEVRLEANPDYYNGRPALDAIVFHYQPDRELAWIRLLKGETDISQEISFNNYEMTKYCEEKFYFDRYILPYYTILLYNTHDPLFSDTRVRMALTHAIDREYIVRKILKGSGKVANGPMGVESSYHNPKAEPLSYDPKKSLVLLERAGWSHQEANHYLYKSGKPFEFTIQIFRESQLDKDVAQYIRLCLDEIGIKVKVEELFYEELKSRYFRNNRFQAVLTEIDGTYDNREYLNMIWSPNLNGEGAIAGCFEHPEVTSLLKRASEAQTRAEKFAVFHQIEALIISLQPGTFLFQKEAINVMSKRFNLPSPFHLNYAGIYGLQFASLKTH
jgi:peptide/nickel transport system substrate-binding protein